MSVKVCPALLRWCEKHTFTIFYLILNNDKRKVVVGNPAKIVKDVTEEIAKWKTEGTKIYQALPKQLHETLKECDPLHEIPGDMPEYKNDYRTWGDTK